MKLLATADLHLHEWQRFGQVDRLDDQAQVLDQVADLADERDVDAVLIAGDVFHRPHPSPRALKVFGDFARRLHEHDRDVLAITGNASHDIENAERFCALELFTDRVDVQRGPGTRTVAGVDVICLPSVPMGNLVARANGKDRDELHAEAGQLLLDTIWDELSHHRAMTSARGRAVPVVVLGHWHVDRATTSNGILSSDFFREPLLPLHELAALPVAAVVLGHNHRAQLLVDAPAILHCGSPLPLNHGEGTFPHGVWLLDFETDELYSTQFVPLESRPLVTFDLDVENWLSDGEPLDLAVEEGAIVRVRYTATQEQARRVDGAAIRRRFADAGAALVTLHPEIVREDRARVEGLDDGLSELDAVRLYCDANEIHAPEDGELLDLTRGYLETVTT